ncbi:hypothetical protein [Streptomyces anandii]|uniref:hypothetical protein n=1 Tax=Streptomyces anandii TaxID=285454 RepID=UPI00378B5C90
MRRTTTAVLLAAALGLTGCGNGKPATKPSPSPTVRKEDAFLSAVHAANFTSWQSQGPTDDELLTYPPKWCDGLDAGHSVKYLFSSGGAFLYPIGEEWGTKEAEADELLVMAVRVYCPRDLAVVKDELRASGNY